MKRPPLVLLTLVLLIVLAACGDSDSKQPSGLHILGGPVSPSPSASTSTSASPSASPSPSASVTVSASPSASATGGESTADELETYFAETRPLYASFTKIATDSGGMLVELSQLKDSSWDTAAGRMQGYADQLASAADLWRNVTPPADLAEVHEHEAEALEIYVREFRLIARRLYNRTYDPVNGNGDWLKLARKAGDLEASWRVAIQDQAQALGVKVPFKFPD